MTKGSDGQTIDGISMKRINESCHTALNQIQTRFTGVKWFVEGDIKGFFDNINHEILIKILKKKFDDERFLRLVRKLLNAGIYQKIQHLSSEIK